MYGLWGVGGGGGGASEAERPTRCELGTEVALAGSFGRTYVVRLSLTQLEELSRCGVRAERGVTSHVSGVVHLSRAVSVVSCLSAVYCMKVYSTGENCTVRGLSAVRTVRAHHGHTHTCICHPHRIAPHTAVPARAPALRSMLRWRCAPNSAERRHSTVRGCTRTRGAPPRRRPTEPSLSGGVARRPLSRLP